jgi:hypothetical protein
MKRPIDYHALSLALSQKAGERHYRECAAECGISATTFGRLVRNCALSVKNPRQHGRKVAGITTEVVYKVCSWLGMPVESFTEKKAPPKPSADTCDAIDFYLMRDPALTEAQATQLSNMLRASYKAVAREEDGK